MTVTEMRLDDATVRKWLADAEMHRQCADLAISERARLDHIADAARLRQMAAERSTRLERGEVARDE